MIEKIPEVKPTKVNKPEHLKEGISPIIACVGSPEDFQYDGKINWLLSGKQINYAHNVDYYGKPEDLAKSEIKNDKFGHGGYVISPVDSWDKYSREYHDCTGLIMTGVDKITGKNISFISHQNPETFLDKNKARFKFGEDLNKQIEEIKQRCKGGTIDAGIIGGKYGKIKEYDKFDPKSNASMDEYMDSIKFVSEIVKKSVGFEPSLITMPKTKALIEKQNIEDPGDMIFFDNDTRRLFIVRDKYDFGSDQNISPSELDKKRKKWEPGEYGLPN